MNRLMISVFVLVLLFLPGCVKTTKNAKIHYDQGKAYERQGKLDKALEEYNSAIVASPHYIPAHLEYQRLMLQKGQKKVLLTTYERSARENSTSPAAIYLYGRLLDESASRKEAYNKAVSLDSNFVWGYHGLGVENIKSGNIDEAIKQLHRILEIDSEFPPLHIDLCKAYLLRGKADAAYSEIRKYLTLDPESSAGYEQLGLVYKQKKDPVRALEAFQKASELNPLRAQPLVEIASVYFNQEDYARTRIFAERALKISPSNPRAHFLLSLVLQTEGKTAEALDEAKLSLKTAPGDIQMLENYGFLLMEHHSYDEAREVLERVIAKRGKSAVALAGLAQLYDHEGNIEKAVACNKEALTIDPSLMQARRNLAGLLKRTGETRKAIEEYDAVVKKSSATASDHFELGLLMWELKYTSKAQDEIIKAVEQDPRNQEFALSIFLASQVKNRISDGRAILLEISKVIPDRDIAPEYLGLSLIMQNKNDEAIKALKKEAESLPDRSTPRLCSALAYLGKKDYETAKTELDECARSVKTGDSFITALIECTRGVIYGEQGESSRAESAFESADNVTDDSLISAFINYKWACMYLKSRDEKKALLHVEHAITCGFKNWPMLENDPAFSGIVKSVSYKKMKRSFQ
ncbi:MAG: tetratricopeptide repeat protein [Candidatus Xenobiia bacterium LiM19]